MYTHAADHYWWDDARYNYSHYHPHERAPRCLPCHWTPQDEERSMREDGYKPFEGYPACPCTVQHICTYDQRNLFDEDCHMPTYPERAYRCALATYLRIGNICMCVTITTGATYTTWTVICQFCKNEITGKCWFCLYALTCFAACMYYCMYCLVFLDILVVVKCSEIVWQNNQMELFDGGWTGRVM